ncbi:MAG: hypothetical protein AAF597_00580, partial [Bacteroidota bacterium]
MFIRLVPLLLVLLTIGCTPKATPSSANDKMDENVNWSAFEEPADLKLGQSFGVKKSDVAFTFTKVVTDSRCPEGLDCFRAGEAVLLITLPGGGTEQVSVPAKGRAPVRFS